MYFCPLFVHSWHWSRTWSRIPIWFNLSETFTIHKSYLISIVHSRPVHDSIAMISFRIGPLLYLSSFQTLSLLEISINPFLLRPISIFMDALGDGHNITAHYFGGPQAFYDSLMAAGFSTVLVLSVTNAQSGFCMAPNNLPELTAIFVKKLSQAATMGHSLTQTASKISQRSSSFSSVSSWTSQSKRPRSSLDVT